KADVRVSTAETLDALNTVNLVGYRDRHLLKDSLALALPKTLDEKRIFDLQFDRFFAVGDSVPKSNTQQQPQTSNEASSGGGTGELGELPRPGSALGEMLMTNAPQEIELAIAAAGAKANVHEIAVFTQKNIYTRRIMDDMGLAELQSEIDALRVSRDP